MKRPRKQDTNVNYIQCGDKYYAMFVVELKIGSGLKHGTKLKSKLEALAEGVEITAINNLRHPEYNTQVLEGTILKEVWESKFNGKLVKREHESNSYLEDLNRENIQLPEELQEYKERIESIRIERILQRRKC